MRPSRGGFALPRSASGVLATFVDQKPNKAVHRGIVGATDERRRLTLLRDQTSQNQPMQVVRERRGGDPQSHLEMTNRQATIARPNERAIELEAGRVTERFELLRCFFDFHGNMCSSRDTIQCQSYFYNFGNYGGSHQISPPVGRERFVPSPDCPSEAISRNWLVGGTGGVAPGTVQDMRSSANAMP